ncbi:hypothetical protein HMPREF0591_1656 [Mycobacterium parascrofulaceum ATCC BAA-614]|uniref:Uncharacterized protein n=1 Tax=Mycobacterium parascrofulaceum ATCC BAA-614 TaxID=525368 RepID=D5P662_9MYCO|nr:hypothetical protein [Mycobacterium parascrofulaceum]EFG78435.1 hypothetical protein HMPREF0591_1656 [Mycobacterium parascrofulaceum ATCC BAA-614]
MPKKDTTAAVIGMLSSAGAQTRPVADSHPRTQDGPVPTAVTVTQEPRVSVTALPTSRRSGEAAAGEAPRTLRLRPATAQRLRQAWLEAKRDDVLLTAQDFASDLVEQALQRRRRSAAQT